MGILTFTGVPVLVFQSLLFVVGTWGITATSGLDFKKFRVRKSDRHDSEIVNAENRGMWKGGLKYQKVLLMF